MSNKNPRYVEGLRVVKRYNAPILFSGLLAMVIAIIPAMLLFFPWLNVSSQGVQVPTSAPELDLFTSKASFNITGLDLIKFMFNLESNASSVVTFGKTLDDVGNNFLYGIVANVLMYGSAGILLFLYFLCVIEFLIGFFTMVRGKKRKTKTLSNLSGWIFFFTILLVVFSIGTAFGINFGYMQVAKAVEGATYSGINLNIGYLIPLLAGTFLAMLLLSIFYAAGLRKVVFKDDVIFEGPEVKNYLGREVTEIPDKAFNKNLSLEIAEIPEGIPSLGNSAFANCVNLRVVEIPKSVTKIGYNCFFNCCKLHKIVYHGDKISWRKIQRGSNWLLKANTNLVQCDDGVLIVDPSK